MGREATEHIRVRPETWQQLNARKRPGESFDDVLRRLLDDSTPEDGTSPSTLVE